ncbi:MAG: UbiA family prenyltransferase [Bacteroidales bacterium]|nr:UbiA family prenyltransferase [Bacteroidales bacterium]
MHRIIEKIESNKASFWQCVTALFAVCMVRNVEETVLIRHQVLDSPSNVWRSIATFFCHFNSFWFMAFAALVLLLYLFTRRWNNIRNCLMVGLFATPVILIPPVLSLMLGDRGAIAYPSNPLDLLPMLLHFFDPTHIVPGVTIGMRIEIALAALAAAIYVYVKSKRPIRAVLTFIVVVPSILLMGSLVPIAAQLYENGLKFDPDFKLSASTLIHGGDIFESGSQRIALIYLFLTVLMAFVVLWIHNRQEAVALVRNIRPTRSVHYLLLYFGGTVTALILMYPDVANKWAIFSGPVDYFGVFMGALALFFAFQGAVVFNDLYDYNIDLGSKRPLQSGAITPHRYKNYGIVFFLLAMNIALCISLSFFMLLLTFILLSFLYSTPPFRCRRSLVCSCLILSLEAVLAFALGASLFAQSNVFLLLPDNVYLLLLAAFCLVLPIKDLKDYAGDKAAGVHTLPTLLGPLVGKIVTSCLVCMVIVLLPIMLGMHTYWLPVVYAFLALVTFYLPERCHRLREPLLFLLYFSYMTIVWAQWCLNIAPTPMFL